MATILGIDYGKRHIGIAISDEMQKLASPLTSLSTKRGKDPASLIEAIVLLIKTHGVGEIVVGMPINMDGTRGPQADEVARFAKKLGVATMLPVNGVDERLTTWEAEQQLKEAGLSAAKRREVIDQAAAVLILQQYLDRQTRPNDVTARLEE